MVLDCWKFSTSISNGWTACGIALVSLAAGAVITARLAQVNQVRAESNRVFELRVYHKVGERTCITNCGTLTPRCQPLVR
jgi:hypothetical protein